MRNKRFDLTESIRHHNAISAITASASRGLIRKGDIRDVRDFLDKLNIRLIANPRRFKSVLNRKTRALAKLLPKGRWGAARKFLNLYLRRITYNFYLRKHFRLDRIEAMLELPMDSFAAKALRQENKQLPRWRGVSRLEKKENDQYQRAAMEIAKCRNTLRVHLDMEYWRAE